MNRDIIIVLICILIGYIGLKIYWKNKEHFTETLVKKPDAYNYYAKDEITEKPEIFDYENEMELLDKQQAQYNYHYVDDKIEMPNKIMVEILNEIVSQKQEYDLIDLSKNTISLLDLEDNKKKNSFKNEKYNKEYEKLVNNVVKTITNQYYKKKPKTNNNEGFNLLKFNILEVKEYDYLSREYTINIHISRKNKYSGFIIQSVILVDIQNLKKKYKSLKLISRPLVSKYSKIEPNHKGISWVHLSEDPEKICYEGVKSKNVYCIMSQNNLGNSNNIINKNHEVINRKIIDRKIISSDVETKKLVDNYLKKNNKFVIQQNNFS